jgi:Methyltransferase domain
MKFNDWEHFNPDKYLWDTPKEDFGDIVSYIKESKAQVVMELGFGTGVLMPELLKLDITYYGFDKTKAFVENVRKNNKKDGFSYGVLDICDIELLQETVFHVNPDLILIRNTLEYVPSWPVVIDYLNSSKVKDIIISTFAAPAKKSHSEVQFSKDKKNAYTMNFINHEELISYLSSYNLVKNIKYGERYMLRTFHLK